MKRTTIALFSILASLAMAAPTYAANRYHGQHGYHERPYNKQRHYNQYRHNHREYGYRGHWRSWKSWEAYRLQHRDRFRDGHYYRQDGHLMFRFCDPHGGSCFFFSIGR
jgi:hypothetical protein